jgi:hypothetical protein
MATAMCLLLAMIMLSHATPAPANERNTTQPNILFFLIDDYGHSDIGYHSEKYDNLLKTPTLDALATQGIKLENYYVQVCHPNSTPQATHPPSLPANLHSHAVHPDVGLVSDSHRPSAWSHSPNDAGRIAGEIAFNIQPPRGAGLSHA